MIIYNFRNRGPFEYDKFILNALQIKNQVNYLLKQQEAGGGLTTYEDNIDKQFNSAEQHCHDVYMTLVDYGRY